MSKKYISGEFGLQYTQFRHKPKLAIKHLKRAKGGECIAALYRADVGDIDIPWGKVTSKEKVFPNGQFQLVVDIDHQRKLLLGKNFRIKT